MNQHGSFLCEELLPRPISILGAAPAPWFCWEAHGNCTLDVKGKGVKEGMSEGRMENPWESRNGAHRPCAREEAARGAGSSA